MKNDNSMKNNKKTDYTPVERAPRITTKQREEMWLAFLEKQSTAYVSAKCGVSEKTVRRYREIDNWDDRFVKIRSQAMEDADQEASQILAAHYEIPAYLRNTLFRSLKTIGTKLLRDQQGNLVRDENGNPILDVHPNETPSKLARAAIEVMKFERSLYEQTNTQHDIKGEYQEMIDRVMEEGGERAERLRKLMSEMTDIVKP